MNMKDIHFVKPIAEGCGQYVKLDLIASISEIFVWPQNMENAKPDRMFPYMQFHVTLMFVNQSVSFQLHNQMTNVKWDTFSTSGDYHWPTPESIELFKAEYESLKAAWAEHVATETR